MNRTSCLEQYYLCVGVHMNIHVSEAAISQIVRAIRFGTPNLRLNPCRTFSVSRLHAATCRIPAHSWPIKRFARFCFSYVFSWTIYHQIAFETWSQNGVRFSSSEAKLRKNVPPAGRLQRGPPGVPPAGGPHQPRGGRGRGEAATTGALVGFSVRYWALYSAG